MSRRLGDNPLTRRKFEANVVRFMYKKTGKTAQKYPSKKIIKQTKSKLASKTGKPKQKQRRK